MSLVLRSHAGRPIWCVSRRRHPQEADLADLHAGVERDREVGHVRQLEGEVAVPSGVDEAGGRVDEQPEPPERRLAVEAGDEVIGKLDPFEGGPEHEFTWVEDERAIRDMLAAEGHELRSETDTEAIAHLVEDAYAGDLAEAVRAALSRVE